MNDRGLDRHAAADKWTERRKAKVNVDSAFSREILPYSLNSWRGEGWKLSRTGGQPEEAFCPPAAGPFARAAGPTSRETAAFWRLLSRPQTQEKVTDNRGTHLCSLHVEHQISDGPKQWNQIK